MRKSTGNQTESRKRESKNKGSAVLVRFLKELSELNVGGELRIKSVSEVCKTLNDLRQIARDCEGKCVSATFEDDGFTINGKEKMSLAEALDIIIRARKIIVSAQTKSGLDKARKAGKRLGALAGRPWKIKKLTGREKEIQTFLDNKITLSAIARALKVDNKTLKTFMKDNGLERNKVTPPHPAPLPQGAREILGKSLSQAAREKSEAVREIQPSPYESEGGEALASGEGEKKTSLTKKRKYRRTAARDGVNNSKSGADNA